MDKVKELMALGLTVGEAIRKALELKGLSVKDFAAKYELAVASASTHINAVVRPAPATLNALTSELGATPEAWHELLWEAMRPPHLAAS